jgi:hypothetical protein
MRGGEALQPDLLLELAAAADELLLAGLSRVCDAELARRVDQGSAMHLFMGTDAIPGLPRLRMRCVGAAV